MGVTGQGDRAGARWAATILVAGIGLIASALAGGAVSGVAWGLLVPAIPAALVGLAARRGGRGRSLLALGLLLGGQAALVALLVVAAGGRQLAGLPAGTVLMLLGLGLAPLVAVPLAYAWTFDRRSRDPRTPGRDAP